MKLHHLTGLMLALLAMAVAGCRDSPTEPPHEAASGSAPAPVAIVTALTRARTLVDDPLVAAMLEQLGESARAERVPAAFHALAAVLLEEDATSLSVSLGATRSTLADDDAWRGASVDDGIALAVLRIVLERIETHLESAFGRMPGR